MDTFGALSHGENLTKNVVVLGQLGGLGLGIRTSAMLGRISGLAPTIFVSNDNRRGLAWSTFRHPRALAHTTRIQMILGILTENVLPKLERLRPLPNIVQAETTGMGHLARLFSQRSGIPYILDLHGLWAVEYESISGRRLGKAVGFMRDVERRAALEASHVIVVSNRMKEYVVANYGVSPNKIIVIPNGGFISERKAVYANPPTLVFGGMFSYYERVLDFLEMSLLPSFADSRFLVLGAGKEQRLVRARLRKNPSEKVAYLGLKSRSEALEVFRGAQIGIAPSTSDLARQVAWPVKIMDYMSCGLPVVAPNVGDWGEMLRKSGAGIATPHSDPREFASAALQLRDKEAWAAAARRSVETIEAYYLWEHLLQSLDGIYSDYL